MTAAGSDAQRKTDACECGHARFQHVADLCLGAECECEAFLSNADRDCSERGCDSSDKYGCAVLGCERDS